MTEKIIVCTNEPQGSVCFVMKTPEEIDNYLFLDDRMRLVEMPVINKSYDLDTYAEYFVVNGEWVHGDDIDPESIDPDKPAKLK